MGDGLCMRPSNDISQDKRVDLTTLGVVDLDTFSMPDVFGLRAFDSWEPVVQVLPGEFGNTVRVLVPDATVMPVGFHDVMLENTGSACLIDIASGYYLPQKAVAVLCLRTCISGWQTWSPCVVTVSGSLIVSLVVLGPGLSKSVPAYHRISFVVQSALVVAGRVVFSLEGDGTGLHGSLEWQTQRSWLQTSSKSTILGSKMSGFRWHTVYQIN